MWRCEIQRHSRADSLSPLSATQGTPLSYLSMLSASAFPIAYCIQSFFILQPTTTTMALALVGSTTGMAAAAATSKTIAALNLATPFSGTSIRSSDKASKRRTSGLRVQCMQVWPPYDNKRWETLSYLPSLKPEQILKQVDYLLKNKWVPCIEFDEDAYIKRIHGNTPGYYDGRYWVMWKLPMFGCNDASQVMNEINEVSKAYPKAFVRIIGFDSVRQVQCISFIVQKP